MSIIDQLQREMTNLKNRIGCPDMALAQACKQGKFQLQHIRYRANGTSTVLGISPFLPLADHVAFMRSIQNVCDLVS
jgi:hypothetical protein